MAINTTTNYNLKKPDETEFFNVSHQNNNMDIIDTQLKALDDKSDQKATTNIYTATLSVLNWSSGSAPYSQTLTITGILLADTPVVDVVQSLTIATAQAQLEEWSKVSRISTANNSITAYCYDEKPTVDIPIQLKVVR